MPTAQTVPGEVGGGTAEPALVPFTTNATDWAVNRFRRRCHVG
jgi:hypothetical protein